MSEPVRVAVLGATGGLGSRIMSALTSSELKLQSVLPVGSARAQGRSIDVGESSMTVQSLDRVDWSQVDLVMTAVPSDFNREELRPLLESGGIVIDASGLWSSGEGAPLVSASCNPELLEEVLASGVVRSPSPAALALAWLAHPLRSRYGLAGIRATVTYPASIAGQAGSEELSRQVVTLFNGQEPPRRVFPLGLAFDLMPQWGALNGAGWSALEAQVAQETTELLALAEQRVSVTSLVLPTFVGMGLSVQLIPESSLRAEQLIQLWESSSRISYYEHSLKPLMLRSRLEKEGVGAGRLREDPLGSGFQLWASCDPLQIAARHAVELAEQVVHSGYL